MELYNFLSFLNSPLFAIFLILLPFLCLILLFKPKENLHNLPPSPPKLPLIGNLHQLGKLPHRSLSKLSRKYGPLMLLHLGRIQTLVVSSLETAQQVLQTHDSECCSRTYFHGASKLTYNFLDVAFSPFSEYWRDMRKLCVTELLTVKRVQSFWHVRKREISRFVNSINSEISGSRDSIDVNEKFFTLTKNIVCSLAFGNAYSEGRMFEGFDKLEEAMAMSSSFWANDFFSGFGWVFVSPNH